MAEKYHNAAYWREVDEAVGLLMSPPQFVRHRKTAFARRMIEATSWPSEEESMTLELKQRTTRIRMIGLTVISHHLLAVEEVGANSYRQNVTFNMEKQRIDSVHRRLVEGGSVDNAPDNIGFRQFMAEHMAGVTEPEESDYELLLNELRRGIDYWE